MSRLDYMDTIHASPGRPRPGGKRWRHLTGKVVNRLAALIGAWRERTRQRRALLELSDAMLKDIGLSRADVWQETRKPFWRP